MTMQILPFIPELARFIDAFDKAEYIDYIPQPSLEDIVDNYKKEDVSDQPIKTGIIQSFYETLKRADEDYQSVTKARFTGRTRDDNRIEADIENFYNDRCQLYADEIVQHINGLIQLDGYDTATFGNWRNIAKAVRESRGRTKAMYLKQLIIHSLTTIPVDIREVHYEVVEPSIASSKRTRIA